MKRALVFLLLLILLLAAAGTFYLHGKQPQRDGNLALAGLQAPVSVAYDERGVPHIRAANEADAYRALGYVQAQDRLFQMEILRRLARGELAEVLGPKLVDTDRLFRTLRIRDQADHYVARQNRDTPAWRAVQAYLDGINAFQATHPKPLEFDLLGIKPRPFTAEDVYSVIGYTAYSFAVALRSEPTLTFVRDKLGTDYLKIFDQDWKPDGALAAPSLATIDWNQLNALASLSQQAVERAGVAQFEGSNAWAVAGNHTRSGKPLLAGDPHIRFAAPSVWYEAQITVPGFELYGYYQSLNPFASLGHNMDFGWTLTMFQNDDLDLIAEKTNPANPDQVWYHGQWVNLLTSEQRIAVKGEDPVILKMRESPHGPIVNDALPGGPSSTPIAMWWAFLNTDNPIIEAFYQLNRADTLDKARAASAQISAPGLNVVWANRKGDIGWWASAQLPRRPPGVNPAFILDGSRPDADKDGFYPFSSNPHEENPARGFIVSANTQPPSPSGEPIPGYYNLPDRGQQLNRQLSVPGAQWDLESARALQLGTRTGYGQRLLAPLLDDLRNAAGSPEEQQWVEGLATWQGDYPLDSLNATLFNQFLYQLADAALRDELGDAQFNNLLSTRLIDFAMPLLAADAHSPWWDDRTTPARETRADIVKKAWQASIAHLKETFGSDTANWTWGKAHTLTHGHPLGMRKPLDKLFNVGPFAAPGSHEVPNNLSAPIGPAPWAVTYGPSTRRLIDFADPAHALGINPVGQSGVLFDSHYGDQAKAYIDGVYEGQYLEDADVQAHTRSVLRLEPQR